MNMDLVSQSWSRIWIGCGVRTLGVGAGRKGISRLSAFWGDAEHLTHFKALPRPNFSLIFYPAKSKRASPIGRSGIPYCPYIDHSSCSHS